MVDIPGVEVRRMAKKGRPGNTDYEMQQEIYGRVNYHETPQSAIDKEKDRVRLEKALNAYQDLAELGGIEYTYTINQRITKYIKDNIL